MEPDNNSTQNPNPGTGASFGESPVFPMQPTQLEQPIQQIQPMQPAQPTESAQLEQLAESTQPIQPEQLAEPMRPTQPLQSVQLGQPDQPIQSAQSIHFNQPTETVQTLQSVQTAQSAPVAQPVMSERPSEPTSPASLSSLQSETFLNDDGSIGPNFSADQSRVDNNSVFDSLGAPSNANSAATSPAVGGLGTSFANPAENNVSKPLAGFDSSNNTPSTNSVPFNDPAGTISSNQNTNSGSSVGKPKKTNLIVLIAVAVVVIIALVVVLVMQMNGGGLSSSIQDDTISDSGEAEDAWEVMKGTLLVCEMKPLEKINDQDVESATVTYLVEDNKITTTSVSLEILDEDGEVGFMKELSSYDGLFMGENIEADEIIEGDGTLKVDLQEFANRLAELLDGDSRLENVSCTVELT